MSTPPYHMVSQLKEESFQDAGMDLPEAENYMKKG